MCITLSGEYEVEKITSDQFIGYAPTTTYDNDGQSIKINKQVPRER